MAKENKTAKESTQVTPNEETEVKETTEMPEKSTELVEAEKLIAKLEDENAQLEDKYLRSEAEMANMTSRFKKEREQLLKYEGQDLIKEILPVLDNLERAMAADVSDQGADQLKRGVEMVINNLQATLERFKVVKIAALGETFNPNLHQAVQSVPAEKEEDQDKIVQVFQTGYMLKDRVIRPAMVVVAQ